MDVDVLLSVMSEESCRTDRCCAVVCEAVKWPEEMWSERGAFCKNLFADVQQPVNFISSHCV